MGYFGLALTFPLMNLAAAFGSLVGVGAATLVSVKLGQKDYDTAQRVLGNVLVLNIIIGLAFYGSYPDFPRSDSFTSSGEVRRLSAMPAIIWWLSFGEMSSPIFTWA